MPIQKITSGIIQDGAIIAADITSVANTQITGNIVSSQITSVANTQITGILSVANGGTGTASPAIVAGTNITVSGTWPNQTINATAGGSGTVTSASVVSANGFAGTIDGAKITSTRSAKARPCGLAQGPDGSIYVSDDTKGSIFKISYQK